VGKECTWCFDDEWYPLPLQSLFFVQLEGKFESDHFGNLLALNENGTVLAVGAEDFDGLAGVINTGLVRIYRFDGSEWQQLGQDIYGEGPADHVPDGLSFSVDGTILVVGTSEYDSPGGGDNNGFTKVYQ